LIIEIDKNPLLFDLRDQSAVGTGGQISVGANTFGFQSEITQSR
jgi:hypothetical protein